MPRKQGPKRRVTSLKLGESERKAVDRLRVRLNLKDMGDVIRHAIVRLAQREGIQL